MTCYPPSLPPRAWGRLLGLTTLLTLGALPALADSAVWDGSTDATWLTGTNWDTDPATAPGTGEVATFSGAGNGNTTIDLGSGVTIGSLLFDTADAASYTIGAGAAGSQALTLDNAGTITVNAGVTNSQLFNATIQLSNAASATATILNNSGSLLAFAGSINANLASGNGRLTLGGSGDISVSGDITKTGAGSNALLKTGSGTVTLSGNSTWSGTGASSGGFSGPLIAQEGTLLLAGGTHTVTGELVIGGVVSNGGAGQNAKIQVDSGALNVSTWLSIGRGNGVGGVSSDLVLNNAATVTAANMSAGFNGGSTANLPKGSITLNGTSSLSINSGGAFFLAESAGSNFTMTLNDASSVTINGSGSATNRAIGNLGAGTLNINGTSSFTNAGGVLNVGYQNGTGIVNVNGGTFANPASELRVGASNTNGAFTGSGTFNLSSGSVTVGALTVARGNNNQALINGTVNVTGGTFTSTGDVVVGYAGAGNVGLLHIDGGTFNEGTTATKWLMVGTWDTTQGQLVIDSGALNLNASSSIKMNRQTGTGANVITQNGGTVTFYSDNATTVGGSGALDMQFSGAAASSNTYHLNGGVLTVPQVISTATTGTRTFNFNGGTLRAAGSTSSFFNLGSGSGTARANVRNGGAKIDTNGFNVTIGQALLHSNIDGDAATDGGLTKTGSGTLTLSGSSTYTGTTTVEDGTLSVTGSLVSGVFVDPTAALTGSGTISGASVILGDLSTGVSPALLTFGSDLTLLGSVTLDIDGLGRGTGYSALDIGGNLSAGGSLTFDIGTTLNDGDSFSVMQIVGSQSGSFSQVNVTGSLTGSLTNSAGVWSGIFGGLTLHYTEATGDFTAEATASSPPVPEPATYAALLGGVALAWSAWRRKALRAA